MHATSTISSNQIHTHTHNHNHRSSYNNNMNTSNNNNNNNNNNNELHNEHNRSNENTQTDAHRNSVGHSRQQAVESEEPIPRTTFKLKVGFVGDAQVGKTSLMVKYVQNVFDDEYIQTLGVHHLEKKECLKYADILFVINDLGGQREFVNMLPIVSEDAVAIVYMFDLTRPETLTSIKEWYRQAKGLNNKAISILVGTKYDLFIEMDTDYQEKISKIATLYSEAMNSPLIFSSTSESINVKVIFKIIVAKSFNLNLLIQEINNIGDPLLLYKNLGNKLKKTG